MEQLSAASPQSVQGVAAHIKLAIAADVASFQLQGIRKRGPAPVLELGDPLIVDTQLATGAISAAIRGAPARSSQNPTINTVSLKKIYRLQKNILASADVDRGDNKA